MADWALSFAELRDFIARIFVAAFRVSGALHGVAHAIAK